MKGQALSLGLATVMLVVLLYKQFEQEMDLRAVQGLVLTLEEKMQSKQDEIERTRASIRNVQVEEEAMKKTSVELDAKKDDRTAKLGKEKASFDACQAQKKEAQDKKKAAQDQLQEFKAQRAVTPGRRPGTEEGEKDMEDDAHKSPRSPQSPAPAKTGGACVLAEPRSDLDPLVARRRLRWGRPLWPIRGWEERERGGRDRTELVLPWDPSPGVLADRLTAGAGSGGGGPRGRPFWSASARPGQPVAAWERGTEASRGTNTSESAGSGPAGVGFSRECGRNPRLGKSCVELPCGQWSVCLGGSWAAQAAPTSRCYDLVNRRKYPSRILSWLREAIPFRNLTAHLDGPGRRARGPAGGVSVVLDLCVLVCCCALAQGNLRLGLTSLCLLLLCVIASLRVIVCCCADELCASIVRSHRETCQYRVEDLQALRYKVFSGEEVLAYQRKSVEEMWERCACRLTDAIQYVVEFAKRVDGFLDLCQNDQIVLLKAGSMEVVLIRMSRVFNPENSTVFFEGKYAGSEVFKSLERCKAGRGKCADHVPGCHSQLYQKMAVLKSLCSLHMEKLRSFRQLYPLIVHSLFPPLYKELFTSDSEPPLARE
nr:PREDICTED: nuclear receptor ROR-gamma [Lepisosteus oculatus]